MQSDAQARERRPPVGTARRRRAAGKDPEFGGGSPLGRDPGVQRHPDGCVVHAFRCASRGDAGPHRENWPEVWRFLPGVPPCPRGYVLRGEPVGVSAVRGPAGRCADRRSAFPGGRRHLDGWGSAGLHFHSNRPEAGVPSRPRAFSPSATCGLARLSARGAGVKAPPGELAGVPWPARHPGCRRPGARAFIRRLVGGPTITFRPP